MWRYIFALHLRPDGTRRRPPPATTANEGTGSPVTGSPPNPTLVPSPYGELFFAEHRGTGHPDAQLTGRLVVDEEGCLRLIGMSQAPGETIIWLPRYDLAVDGNKLRILGSNGEVVATVGDYVEMSGDTSVTPSAASRG